MNPLKPGPNASSSDDLAQARALSRALREGAGAGAQKVSPYVTFPHALKPAPAVSRPTEVPSAPLLTRREPLEAPRAEFGARTWNSLLEAAAKAVSADAAFLMNSQGLLVASRGSPVEELEALGARLMVVLAEADRLNDAHSGEMLSLTLESPKGTIHGVRLRESEDSGLTLGLLIASGLTAERQARLVQVLTAASKPKT
jgi:hypothetical protein